MARKLRTQVKDTNSDVPDEVAMRLVAGYGTYNLRDLAKRENLPERAVREILGEAGVLSPHGGTRKRGG